MSDIDLEIVALRERVRELEDQNAKLERKARVAYRDYKREYEEVIDQRHTIIRAARRMTLVVDAVKFFCAARKSFGKWDTEELEFAYQEAQKLAEKGIL